ncbi:cytidylyltransferase domain-containing protein [Psychromonas aquimarina]|uniref:acylneuraminate cytidylyltransferase family protein n=1 Tax=Psychromonas aquimarina TaxID=444919 RepID=UPI0004043B35|nr:acylneuraminate cytidylyltransferase family protein [Psychromonas aquimarina]
MKNGNRKVLAIIPARGGSKRLPRKNILSLAGKPLIAWSIDAAIGSQIFDQIIVNTDNSEIAEIAEQFGATVPFLRPEALASDTASSIDVIKHTLLWYLEKGVHFTEVVLLQATSPLRNSNDIKEAFDIYTGKAASSVLSVCEVDHPTQWCNTLDDSLSMNNFVKESKRKSRSQDFDKEFRLNGAIYIWNVEQFLTQNAAIIEPSFASIMPRIRSIDIDEEIDFKIAQCLLDTN